MRPSFDSFTQKARRFGLKVLERGLGVRHETRPKRPRQAPLRRGLAAVALVLLTSGAAKAPAPLPAHAPTPVIESIAWRDVGLVIQASAPLDPQLFTLEHPHRFVVDLPGADLADATLLQALQIHSGSMGQMRVGRKPNGTVRLVIDCTTAAPLQVMQLQGRQTLVIADAAQTNKALTALLTPQEGAAHGPGTTIQRIWAHESRDRLEVSLTAAKPLTCSLFAEDPTHTQIKIPGAHFVGLLPLPGKLLAGVRIRTPGENGWVLDTALADGSYQLEQVPTPDRNTVVLRWTRLEVRRFPGRPLVVIDPGHGGTDPGALGAAGGQEKADCLALALQLEHTLWSHRINAVMTRSADLEMYLEPRLKLIDQVHADLFVSLHANSHTERGSTGTEAFWREPASRDFATAIESAVTSLVHRPDRGVKQERLYVLRNTHVPSVLLESAFISNPGEEALLANHAFQAKVADAITAGIERYVADNQKPALGALPANAPSTLHE